MDPFPFQLELSAEHAVSVCNRQHLRQTPEVSQRANALAVIVQYTRIDVPNYIEQAAVNAARVAR